MPASLATANIMDQTVTGRMSYTHSQSPMQVAEAQPAIRLDSRFHPNQNEIRLLMAGCLR